MRRSEKRILLMAPSLGRKRAREAARCVRSDRRRTSSYPGGRSLLREALVGEAGLDEVIGAGTDADRGGERVAGDDALDGHAGEEGAPAGVEGDGARLLGRGGLAVVEVGLDEVVGGGRAADDGAARGGGAAGRHAGDADRGPEGAPADVLRDGGLRRVELMHGAARAACG